MLKYICVCFFQVEEEEPICTASKARCLVYSNIITAAVDEICSGLQFPADLETMLAWQQKIHVLVLYTLIKNKYKAADVRNILTVTMNYKNIGKHIDSDKPFKVLAYR